MNKQISNILYKGSMVALAGVLFGGVSFATNEGLDALFSKNEAVVTSTSSNQIVQTSTSTQNLDVETLTKEQLPCIVAITNTSVSKVQQYFDLFSRGGSGYYDSPIQETTSCGSGIIISQAKDKLYIVTNNHVIEDATTLSVSFVDESSVEAQVEGYDASRDIAVISVDPSQLSADTLQSIKVATIGDSTKLSVGQQVVAIGNALGYGQSVTTGILSATDRQIATDATGVSQSYLQTDAAINPGNSGGALFNMNGELIGINTAKASSTGVEGMGYAIPISDVYDLIQSMLK